MEVFKHRPYHRPRTVKRKMSNYPTRSRAKPLLPPRQTLKYASVFSSYVTERYWT